MWILRHRSKWYIKEFTSGNGGSLQFTTYQDVESVHIIPAVLLDPKNVGVAFEISLPTCVQAEIHMYFKFTGRHFGFSTSVYPRLVVQHCRHSH